MHSNFLLSLSRLVQNLFYAIGIVFGITISASVGQIKSAVLLRLFESFNIIVRVYFP